MRTLFLFGSGVSPAPKVQAITQAVLGARMHDDGAGVFRRGLSRAAPMHADYGLLIPQLLERIRNHIAACQRRTLEDVTYEDIGAVIADLDKQSDTRRNPAVQPFYEHLEAALAPLLEGCRNADSEVSFGQLVISANRWIKTVVHDELVGCCGEPHALEDFFNRFLPPAPAALVATTNHDWFIEDALLRIGRSVNVGFVRDRAGRDVFRPQRLGKGPGTPILKLHGSVDWFSGEEVVRSRPETNPDHWRLGREPVVLVGTINKLEDYNYQLFPHLMTAFQNALYKCSRVLVSGYGFLDQGINGRLIDWWSRTPSGQLAVIDPKPEALCARAHWHAKSTVLSGKAPRVVISKAGFEDATTSRVVAAQIERFLA